VVNRPDCQSEVRAAVAMFRHIPRYTSIAFRPAIPAREVFQIDVPADSVLAGCVERGGDGDEVHAVAVAMIATAQVVRRVHPARSADLNIEPRDVTVWPPFWRWGLRDGRPAAKRVGGR